MIYLAAVLIVLNLICVGICVNGRSYYGAAFNAFAAAFTYVVWFSEVFK